MTRLDRIEQRAFRISTGTDWKPEDIPAGFFSVPDVLALVAVARAAQPVTEHHFDTCDLVLGLSPAYPCSCGIDALRAALAALEDE